MSDETRDPVRRWDALTTREVAAWVERDPVVVLTLAAVEQHGPHLPLATDEVIGTGLLHAAFAALGDDVAALALPVQSLGASEEHTAFPGTISLSASTLESIVFDVGASIHGAGARRLVIATSHGGNRAALDVAALRLRRAFGMLVVKTHYPRFPRPSDVTLPESEWIHGLHGGAVETAMMLHLAPELVRLDEVRSFPSFGRELADRSVHLRPEGAAAFAWSADDLAPEGVVGDADLADPEMGARLVAHYGACLADVIRDAARFPVERLGGP